MKDIFTLNLNHMFKKTLICATMLALVVLAVASSGGGKKKSVHSGLGIIPLKSNGLLADETRAGYTGSRFVQREDNRKTTVLRSLATYRRGNTTYLVPSRIRMSASGALAAGKLESGCLTPRSNLQVVDLKVRLGK